MSDNNKAKFGIVTDRHPNGWWSLGVSIHHMEDETYLHLSLFKWCISIGFLYEDWI